MNKEFIEAIEQLEKEKGMSQDLLYEALEAALTKAYKKSVSPGDGRKKDSDINLDVEVRIDRTTGDIEVVAIKEVVEDDELTDPYKQIALSDARMIDPDYEIGEYVEYPKTPDDFGRIAAQTAKNVLVQKIRDAERVMIYNEFIDKKGQVLTGRVARKYNDTIYVNLGKTEGILSAKEQVPGEKFNIDERIKVYVMDVKDPNSEPEPKAGEKRKKKKNNVPIVFLSRSHPYLVKCLFAMEVPEIEEGLVEIKEIAREAGSRTKMMVYTEDENIDPVGACVGARGARVQNVVDELFNEKIDIIPWSEDPVELVTNALSPARVEEVFLDEDAHIATVIVPDYQLSLAIGKSGQNVRLAAKLCNWKIDIKSHTQYYGDDEEVYEDEYEESYEEAPAEEAVTEEAPAEEMESEDAEAPEETPSEEEAAEEEE